MSIWTHVNGNIRIDSLRFDNNEISTIKNILGKIIHFDDNDYKTNLPCGSEGSLEYNIVENPNESDISAFSVSIFGDLRDYDDVDYIEKWFNNILNEFLIRNAVLEINVEGQQNIILYSVDDEKGNPSCKKIICN